MLNLLIKHCAFLLLIWSCQQKRVPSGMNVSACLPKSTVIIDSSDSFGFFDDITKRLNDEAIELFNKGEIGSAKKKMIDALKRDPNNCILLNNVGLAFLEENNYYRSKVLFMQSLKHSDSLYFPAGINLGLAYFKLNQYIECIDISELVLSKCENEAMLISTRINLTLAQLSLNQCIKAKRNYNYLQKYAGKYNISSMLKCVDNQLESCSN